MTEYRLEELAHRAGTTVRNIRAYRDRGLLPAPRRQGRIALYSDAHLARLRLVADLLDRGYTLNSIGELLEAWERGKDISDVLGLEEILSTPWSEEPPVILTWGELDSLLPGGAGAKAMANLLELGIIERLAVDRERDATIEGGAADERYRVVSAKQLAAGGELVAAGIGIDEVLDLALYVHRAIDDIAARFTEMVRTRVFDPLGPNPPPAEMAWLRETVANLRPLAHNVVDAELSRAMESNIQKHLTELLAGVAAAEGVGGASSSPRG